MLVVQSIQLFVTPWTVAHQALLGISQARILESVAIPFFRGCLNPGIQPGSPALRVDSLPSAPPRKPNHNYSYSYFIINHVLPFYPLFFKTFFFFFWLHSVTCETIVPQPGIKSTFPPLEGRFLTLDHLESPLPFSLSDFYNTKVF